MLDVIDSLFPASQNWEITPHNLGHSRAHVFFIQKKETQYVLKTEGLAPPFLLRREYQNLIWFADWIPVPAALWYKELAGNAFLLSEKIESNPSFLYTDHQQVGSLLGQVLRTIHGIPMAYFPNQENQSDRQFDFFAKKEKKALNSKPKWDAVLSHGDYCMPNVLLSGKGKAHLIDMGEAGVYDRYHDLFWGMWSLNYNGFAKQIFPFIKAYGFTKLDKEKMELIAQINGNSLDFIDELTIFY